MTCKTLQKISLQLHAFYISISTVYERTTKCEGLFYAVSHLKIVFLTMKFLYSAHFSLDLKAPPFQIWNHLFNGLCCLSQRTLQGIYNWQERILSTPFYLIGYEAILASYSLFFHMQRMYFLYSSMLFTFQTVFYFIKTLDKNYKMSQTSQLNVEFCNTWMCFVFVIVPLLYIAWDNLQL